MFSRLGRLGLLLAAALMLLVIVAGPVFGQTTDYDSDDDGLIDIDSQAKLSAIRHDVNGNGDASHADYIAAFPNRDTSSTGRMGCPSGTCTGYELTQNLTLTGNWTPIGTNAARFATTFDGDGYTISGLTVSSFAAGLFGFVGSGGVIRDLGVLGATATTTGTGGGAGAIAGVILSGSEIVSSYASGGTISIAINNALAGGLVGGNGGTIRASYTTNAVTISGTRSGNDLGGLVGSTSGAIIASYAAGAVSGTGGTGNTYAGFAGRSNTSSSTITNSYCDSTVAGTLPCVGRQTNSSNVTVNSQTTSALQTTSSYTGIYQNWNIDTDGDTNADDPWYFGATYQYPQPHYREPTTPAVDYDADDDDLIDVGSVAQLHAIRHDLDGDGDPATGEDDPYLAGFPGRETGASGRMGCPNTCAGYELTADLTFPASGALSSWTPTATWATTFDGNGHTLTGATISVTTNSDAGLFGNLGATAVIRDLGLVNFTVTATTTQAQSNGILTGFVASGATITNVYASGGSISTSVNGSNAGGLVGYLYGTVTASYSTASVTVTGTASTVYVGGLAGRRNTGTITASYATGAITDTSSNADANVGELVGRSEGASGGITNSYCVAATGNCIGTVVASSAAVSTAAHTAAELQAPTGYTDMYLNWNLDQDGDGDLDYPWKFGANNEYPTLNTPTERDTATPSAMDYDADDDGLIDISTAAQLNAVRWDLNGDGAPETANYNAYGTAFGGRQHTADSNADRMGCPLTTPTMGCVGYELTADLTLTGSWTPMGTPLTPYNATFDGNGHTISGLTISTTSGTTGLFSTLNLNRVIRNVGLIAPSVTSTASNVSVGALVGNISASSIVEASYVEGGTVTLGAASIRMGGLVGSSQGTIRASYSTATLQSTTPCTGCDNTLAGGLVGRVVGGHITASYAAGANSVAAGTGSELGGLVGRVQGAGVRITNSYCDSTTRVVADCVGGRASGVSVSDTTAAGHSTTDLQTPTDYGIGIYSHWNLDLASPTDNVPDYLWNFGANNAYPTLNTPTQRAALIPSAMDYDANDNGLIDISTVAQLNAVRWDANGDGNPDAADAHAYSTAFGGRTHTADAMTGLMGCPATGGCTGYELLSSLTLTGTWTPMDFSATFNGQGYTISGLTTGAGSADNANAGLFGLLSTANGVIRNLGVISPAVTTSGTAQNSGGLVGRIGTGANVETSYVSGGSITASGSNNRAGGLAGLNQGRIRASYATAAVTHSGNPIGVHLGGLVGYSGSAEIVASYAAGAVTASTGLASEAGGLVGTSDGSTDTITDSYCDSSVMLVSACIGDLAGSPASTATAAAHPTTDLQSPTQYAGTIYANWNLDLDGVTGGDNPWDFGTASQYPTLRIPTNRPTVAPILPPDPVQPGNGGGNGNGQTGGGSNPQPVARGGGQPYHPASAHPEIYTNPRHEMSVSCEVRTTGEGDAAQTTSTMTFDLGSYTRPITLVLSLWDGQFFRTLQSQNIPMPALRQDGQTATVEVVTDPAQTRFRLDSEYGLNLVLGYADCHTDDP